MKKNLGAPTVLDRFLNYIDSIQKFLLIISTAIVLFLLGMSVIYRYVMRINMYGLEELVQIAGYYLYFIGAGYSVRLGYDIKADLVDVFPICQKIKDYIHAFANISSIVLAFLFVYWGYSMVSWGMKVKPVTPGLRFPIMISYIGVEMGFVFGFIYTIINAVKFCKSVINNFNEGEC